MKRGVIVLIVLLILIGSANAAYFEKDECTNDGAASFYFRVDQGEKVDVENLKITAISPAGKTLDVTKLGIWDAYGEISYIGIGSLFKSKEVTFNEKGNYAIEIEYVSWISDTEFRSKRKTGEISCPGLIFSCTLLNATVNKCSSKDGKFEAEIILKGLIPSDLPNAKIINLTDGITYNFEADKMYQDIYGSYKRIASLPSNYKITNIGEDKYLIEAEFANNTIRSLDIAFTQSIHYGYYLDIKRCYGANPLPLSSLKYCEILTTPKEEVAKPVETKEPAVVPAKNDYVPTIILSVSIILAAIIVVLFRNKDK